MKKNRIMLLLALLAAVAGILLPIVFMQIRDIPPPDVSDLTVERPAVAPEENAYTYFSRIGLSCLPRIIAGARFPMSRAAMSTCNWTLCKRFYFCRLSISNG
jgi:hypothetical protein